MKNIILLTLAGSRSYGIHTEESDYDYRGIFITPQKALYSCDREIPSSPGIPTGWNDDGTHKKYGATSIVGQINHLPGGWNDDGVFREFGRDSTVYEIRKWFRLAGVCNPNIIESLFVKPEHVIINSKWGEILRDNRHLFLSKSAVAQYAGYAGDQLRRMKNHKMMVDVEKAGGAIPKPSRKEFGLDEKPRYSKDVLGGLINAPRGTLLPAVQEYITKERSYLEAHNKWSQWDDWQKNRNAERAELELKFGFDLKHATHTVRLLTQCEEILTEENLSVWRKDAEYLRSIRNGAVAYDTLIQTADEKLEKIKQLKETCRLKEEPEWEKISELCANLVDDHYKTQGEEK